jgi:hypothetical protein
MMAEQKKVNPIIRRFESVRDRTTFELGIEFFYDDIIKNFRLWLKPLTPENIKELIITDKLPELDPEWFTKIAGWKKYVLQISIKRVAKLVGETRPDLAQAIMDCGEEGNLWFRKLYVHLLECVDHPEKLTPVAIKPEEPGEEMVNACCQSCNKTWPVKRSEVSKIEKCPYCGASAKDEPAAVSNNNEGEEQV